MSASKGPPENSDPVDVWTQVITLPRAHRVVPFPRMNADGVSIGDVAICVLTGEEVYLANMNADAFLRKEQKRIMGEVPKTDELSATQRNMLQLRQTVEILFRSCKKADQCFPDERGVCTTDHSSFSPFFPTKEAVNKLGTDESAVLMIHYMQTQAEVGPIHSGMSQAEMDAWIELLGKGGSRAPLALLSSDQMNEFLMYMASQLHALRTDSCSPGTPLEQST